MGMRIWCLNDEIRSRPSGPSRWLGLGEKGRVGQEKVTFGGTRRYIGRPGSLYRPGSQRGAAQLRRSRLGRCRKRQVCAAPSGGRQAVTNNTIYIIL